MGQLPRYESGGAGSRSQFKKSCVLCTVLVLRMAHRKWKEFLTSKHVAWLTCAWLLLSFFLFPVGHPEHEHCTEIRNQRHGIRSGEGAPLDTSLSS